jgi:hypothetical protein
LNSSIQLSESSRVVLGAFALADAHTLSAETISDMSRGALSVQMVAEALDELQRGGLADRINDTPEQNTGYRLNRRGLEASLELQQALNRKSTGESD